MKLVSVDAGTGTLSVCICIYNNIRHSLTKGVSLCSSFKALSTSEDCETRLRKKYRAKGDSKQFFAISPSVATLCPVVSRKFGKTVIFSHSISSTIYRNGKNVSSRPRVY